MNFSQAFSRSTYLLTHPSEWIEPNNAPMAPGPSLTGDTGTRLVDLVFPKRDSGLTGNASQVVGRLSSAARGVPDANGGYASGYTPGAMQNPDYINAALAEHYGMDRSTAYQEALANTAHQREVQDLIAAGLNPVLSAGAGNGSAVFSGDPMASGGGYVGAAGNSSSAKGLKNVLQNRAVQQGLASAASGITMLKTKNFYSAATAYYATQAALQFLSK